MTILLDNSRFFDNKARRGGGAIAVKVGDYNGAYFLSRPTNKLVPRLFSSAVVS